MQHSAAMTAWRERILDAAESLFISQGFRATTMDAIAIEARVAKATAHAYFADKDAVFKSMAERFCERLEYTVMHALECKCALPERIAIALANKHRIVFEMVRRSPYEVELWTESDRMAGSLIADTNVNHVKAVAKALEERFDEQTARHRAGLIVSRAAEIAGTAINTDDLGRDISTMVFEITENT